ncbi:MAG: RNA pseudouridine synthase [Bacteroidales bacterium]|nr:RNA pseudouridine synthase [Bacteroidales bacterium]
MVPIEKGREAITEYMTLESFRKHTLLEVHPHTGRTHQIRVHLSYLGYPIAGDKIYGHNRSTINLNRQFLHASRLTVLLPGKVEENKFEVTLPQDLNDVLNNLRKQEK